MGQNGIPRNLKKRQIKYGTRTEKIDFYGMGLGHKLKKHFGTSLV